MSLRQCAVRWSGLALSSLLLTACIGTPVQLGARSNVPVPIGPSREVSGKACGFQLFLLFPISINDRLERAYAELNEDAQGDYITDVQVEEKWYWGFVGTGYCTVLTARAISMSHG